MIALVSVPWRQRLWLRLVEWFMAPIPFPGRTYTPREAACQDRDISS
jgi:hypothetical protein